jgi:hypothetical protein
VGSNTRGREDSSTIQNLGSLSPFTGVLGNLFGVGTQVSDSGILFKGQGLEGGEFANRLFSPESLDPLQEILGRRDAGFAVDPGQLGGAVSGALGTFGEATQTGLIDPAVELSRTLFQEEFLPAANETFGTQFGIGPGDSDFNAAVAREGSRRSAELADTAQDRRLLASSQLGDLGRSLFGLEEASRQNQLARTEGGQLLDLLLTLGGVNTQGQVTGVSQATASNKHKGGLK